MKSLFLLYFVTLFTISCSSSSSDFRFYEGYIYNESKKPISDLEIFEKEQPNNKTITDKKGFFKINKLENSVSIFLIIKDNDRLLDSIQIIRKSGGEKLNYYFVEGRSDTLFIKQN